MASALFAEDEFPDYLLCPVCFEIPEKEVYQCRDGHLLCKQCYFKLKECPQCRETLEKTKPIRSRLCEGILEKLKVDCAFKSNGCHKKLIRNQVGKHQAGCYFDFKKFGKLVNICKLIGYTNCNFLLNDGNADEATQHFLTAHGAMVIITSSGTFQTELEDFPKCSKSLTNDCFWTPIVLDYKPKDCFVLISAFGNKTDSSVAFFSIFLPYATNENRNKPGSLPNVEYALSGNAKLSFVHEAIPVKKFANVAVADLPQFEMSFLNRHFTGGNGQLPIVCKILEKPGTPQLEDIFPGAYTCARHIPSTTIWNFEGGSPQAKAFLERGVLECRSREKQVPNFIPFMFNKDQLQASGLLWQEQDLKWVRNGALFIVAENGNSESLTYLVKKGLDINILNENKEGLLYFCIVYDQDKKAGLEKAKLLVEKGADVRAMNGSKRSLLHLATLFSTGEAVAFFLEKGLSANAVDSSGFTPLHTAMLNRKEEEVVKISQLLLEHGASFKVKNENGKTPMDIAMNKISRKTRDKLQQMFRTAQNKRN